MNIPTVNIPNLDSNKLKLALTQYGRMLRDRKSFSQVEQEELQYLQEYKPLPKVDQRSILTKTADEFDQEEKDQIINSNLDLINMIEGIDNANETVIEDLSIQSDYEKMYSNTTGITQVVENLTSNPHKTTNTQEPTTGTNHFDGEHVLTTTQDILSISPKHLVVTRTEQGYSFEDIDLNAESIVEDETQLEEEVLPVEDPFDDEPELEEEEEEVEWEEEEDPDTEDLEPEDPFDDEPEFEDDEEELEDDEDPDTEDSDPEDPFDDEPEFEEDEEWEEEEEPLINPESENIFDEEDDLDFDLNDEEKETNPQPQDIIQEQYEQVVTRTQTAPSKPISGVGRNLDRPVITKPRHTTPDKQSKQQIPNSPTKSVPTIPNIPTPPVNTTKQKVADRLKSDYINNPEVIPREVKSFVTKYRGIKYSDAKMYISSKELDRSLRQGEVILKSNRLW